MSTIRHETRDGGVHLVTIDRPKALNALDPQVLDELSALLDELGDSPRVLILTGAGKAFVAGADIAAMRGLTPVEAETFAGRGQALFSRLAAAPYPVIAAVNGYALGGGCELALACDIVLAGPKALFGQPEVKLGVIPGFGGTQRLARRVGLAAALDLCLTGRNVKAEEACRIGLASRAVEGDVVDEALAVAAELLKMGPVALRYVKRAIHEGVDGDLEAGMAAERSLFGLCFATDDQTEGMAAFLERRPADFQGR